MLALAFDPHPEKEPARRARPSKRTKATTNLSLHERFVLKAEAIFPGSEVLSHQSNDR